VNIPLAMVEIGIFLSGRYQLQEKNLKFVGLYLIILHIEADIKHLKSKIKSTLTERFVAHKAIIFILKDIEGKDKLDQHPHCLIFI
jgi:hypothetical protein